jgi:hypothetical protein
MFVGFIFEFVVMLFDGFIFELPMFEAGDEIATGLVTGEATATGELAGFTLVLALLADSPQAMPRAPRPRTVESRITFFIVFLQTPVFLKE